VDLRWVRARAARRSPTVIVVAKFAELPFNRFFDLDVFATIPPGIPGAR
jgi:hypothetical protein